MKTLKVKLPNAMVTWLEAEAKRTKRGKSVLVRDILQDYCERRHLSTLDLAVDLCGCIESRLGDLSKNKKYLRGFGRER